MRKLLLLLFIVAFSACSPFVTSTPPPPPQPILVHYTSSMRPWDEVLHQCALEHPEIALITHEMSATNLDFGAGDLTLWFGEPPQEVPGYAASLGTDDIVIIAGSEVALRNLDAKQLRDIYLESGSVYQIWTYNNGNELRAIFDRAILGEVAVSAYAMLAPSPSAMLEVIAAEPMAIGYVPASWVTGDVQRISIERELQTAFEHPILALTNTEPEGNLERYLICLQQSRNP